MQPIEAFCHTARLSYLHVGTTGPTIVLLHGWGAFKELWWATLTALAPSAQLFAIDLPGHGQSPIDDTRRMEHIAQRVVQFCTAQQLEQIILVGHSMGGNAAIELTLSQSSLVQSLVLVDAATNTGQMPLYLRSYRNNMITWSILRLGVLLTKQFQPFGKQIPHLHGGGIIRPALRRIAHHVDHDVTALHILLHNLMTNPINTRLSNIQVPTLVISGQFDTLVPPAMSRATAKAIPGAQYCVIPGSSHNPMDEKPTDFVRVLAQFLHLPDAAHQQAENLMYVTQGKGNDHD
ncbi:MAG: alpha/beta hydrolase [Chloroflexota bacterium]